MISINKFGLIILLALFIGTAYAKPVTEGYLSKFINWLSKLTEENDVRSIVKKHKEAVVLVAFVNHGAEDDGLIYNAAMMKYAAKRDCRTWVTSGVMISEDGVVCVPNEYVGNADRIFVHIDSEDSKDGILNMTKNVYEARKIKLIPALNLAFLQITPREKEKFQCFKLGNDATLINKPDIILYNYSLIIGKTKGDSFVNHTHPANSNPHFDVFAATAVKLQFGKVKGVPTLLPENPVGACVIPENAGGAVIVYDGSLMGLAHVWFDQYGIPHQSAIPISTIKQGIRIAVPRLLRHSDKVSLGIRVRIGKKIGSIKRFLEAVKIEDEPVEVESVEIGAPAEASGILPGDIILEINGDKCLDVETFENLIKHSIGEQTVIFKILRSRKILEIEVKR
ncbi:MAG: PDZ domain-containing protein [Holosporales bacterium]|jgi:S1-C subfamily serine protease|nr:PDZ domain-containing protein [Holosporales bacterium]